MKILVDADACPVKNIVIKVAKENNISVTMFIDTSHIINDGYSEVVTVDQARDSVDIALINKCERGDVVITQDYGVAALALPKGARVISQNGLIYDNENIENLLFERHISKKARASGGRTSGPRKRTKDDDLAFEVAFRKLIKAALIA